eukprot:1755606-Amphidinium_carterae.1
MPAQVLTNTRAKNILWGQVSGYIWRQDADARRLKTSLSISGGRKNVHASVSLPLNKCERYSDDSARLRACKEVRASVAKSHAAVS